MAIKTFLGVVIVMVALAIIVKTLAPSLFARGPAYRRKAIMTGNETEFIGRLRRALPDLHICPQVAMHALIEPTASNSKIRLRDFRRVSQKIVDYAVFDAQWAIVVVIELDDRTHDSLRDAARDGYLAAAGIRTLRFQSRAKPTEGEIRVQVQALRQAPLPAQSTCGDA
jgi:very-short-patch-repair endonuclease